MHLSCQLSKPLRTGPFSSSHSSKVTAVTYVYLSFLHLKSTGYNEALTTSLVVSTSDLLWSYDMKPNARTLLVRAGPSTHLCMEGGTW